MKIYRRVSIVLMWIMIIATSMSAIVQMFFGEVPWLDIAHITFQALILVGVIVSRGRWSHFAFGISAVSLMSTIVAIGDYWISTIILSVVTLYLNVVYVYYYDGLTESG